MFLVDAETWTAVPMHLMVDSFSHAPRVLLSDKGQMGLDVTGHRPVSETRAEAEAAPQEDPGTIEQAEAQAESVDTAKDETDK